jgi:hypothetical protein
MENKKYIVPADLSHFYVVTVISNPIRYRRRYELYWRFKEMCEAAGVKLITVEQAFGNRQFMVTEPNNPYNVQVSTFEELWYKENMLNLGIKRIREIDPKAREVAWVDADCRPARTPRDWFEETWHQLQHYQFVQMWEQLIDLDYYFNVIDGPMEGFMARYIKYGTPTLKEWTIQKKRSEGEYYPGGGKGRQFGAPGLAWAANLDALDQVGGILDKSILGAGDWYMAHALIGTMEVVSAHWSSSAYARYLMHWQTLCERWIKRDVGYVQGLVYHDWHGNKKNRFYVSRSSILTRDAYDPDVDVKYDGQGLLQLETWEPRQIKLRDDVRAYFRARNEDELS